MAKVKMRTRGITNSRKSIILDYSPPLKNPNTGKLHRFETLKLYIYDSPVDQWERQHNKETMVLARSVCAQRQLDIQNRRFGFISDVLKDGSFIDFFKIEARKKQHSVSDGWGMGLRYFCAFVGHDLKFPELDDYLCEDYKNYLLSGPGISRTGRPISKNTAVSYYAKLRYILRIAYKKGLIPQDLHSVVKPITPKQTHRERLTLEEFQHLADTPAESDLMKMASLFSGLTGLRFSDVATLKWSELRGTIGKYELQFSQEKTDAAEVMPISDQAVSMMGIQNTENIFVFHGLRYSRMKTFFTHWLADAGIRKNITFHSFRHTFATLQLELGTDIYTVSKMLGHKAFKNTEIYAKIVDKTKRNSADKVMLKLPQDAIEGESDKILGPKSFKFIVHRNE